MVPIDHNQTEVDVAEVLLYFACYDATVLMYVHALFPKEH